MAEWAVASEWDPQLRGIPLPQAMERLGVSEREIGDLILIGRLSVVYVYEGEDFQKLVISENDIQQLERKANSS